MTKLTQSLQQGLRLFHFYTISKFDFQDLFLIALTKCNSTKFYETDSGAQLFEILAKFMPVKDFIGFEAKIEDSVYRTLTKHSSYALFLLNLAENQLQCVKTDILKAATHKTPFYGVMSAISKLLFRGGVESRLVNERFLEEFLNFAFGSVDYFLNVLSSKSNSGKIYFRTFKNSTKAYFLHLTS